MAACATPDDATLAAAAEGDDAPAETIFAAAERLGAPPAFLEAYKAAEGMSTTERPLPQSEPHMQAMIDAGILNARPQGKGRPT